MLCLYHPPKGGCSGVKKAVVFLAAALLVLGSALPLAGYWLAT